MAEQIAPNHRPENGIVAWFSLRMLRKFALKRQKDSTNHLFWQHYQEGRIDLQWLILRLVEETGELIKAYWKGDLEGAIDEAADTGNFSALIAGRLQQMRVERDTGADVVPVGGRDHQV